MTAFKIGCTFRLASSTKHIAEETVIADIGDIGLAIAEAAPEGGWDRVYIVVEEALDSALTRAAERAA